MLPSVSSSFFSSAPSSVPALSHLSAAACKDFGSVEWEMRQIQQNKQHRSHPIPDSGPCSYTELYRGCHLPGERVLVVTEPPNSHSILPETRAGRFQLPQNRLSAAIPGAFVPGIPKGLTRITAACNHCYLQGRIKVLDRCTW